MSELHHAVRNNDLSLACNLLTNGFNIDEKDDMSRTPLHLASWKGNPDMIQLLLRLHATSTIKAKDNFTSLHFAVQTNSLECVKLLVNHNKTLLNCRISKGNKTPLHLATSKGNYEIIKFLLDSGADPCALTNKRQTALDFAKDPLIFQLIKERIEMKIENDTNRIKKRALDTTSTPAQPSTTGMILLTEAQLEEAELGSSHFRSEEPSTPPTESIGLTLPSNPSTESIGPQLPSASCTSTQPSIQREEKIVKIDLNQKKKKQRIGIRLSHLDGGDDEIV